MSHESDCQFNAPAANDARERITIYLDDWRRLRTERDELKKALKDCEYLACIHDPPLYRRVLDLIARIRG